MSNPAFDGNFQIESFRRNPETSLQWSDFASPDEMERAYGRGQDYWPHERNVRVVRMSQPGVETQYTHITFDGMPTHSSRHQFFDDGGWDMDPGIYAHSRDGWDIDPGIYAHSRNGWDIDPGIYMDLPFNGDPGIFYNPRNQWSNGWNRRGWDQQYSWNQRPNQWHRDCPQNWGNDYAWQHPSFYDGYNHRNGSLLQFDPRLAVMQEMMANGQFMPSRSGQIFDPRQAVMQQMWRNNAGQFGFRPQWSRIPANFAF